MNIKIKTKIWYVPEKRKKIDWSLWPIVAAGVLLNLMILSAPIAATFFAEVNEVKAKTPDPCGLEVVVCPGEIEEVQEMTVASWYDYDLPGYPGYSKNNLTAASRDYARETILTVCGVDIDACVDVRVNDYGPEAAIHPDRGIDLSSAAFARIASLEKGLIKVKIIKR